MRSIRIPQDRVGTIIGTKGETKTMLQNISGIKIEVDTEHAFEIEGVSIWMYKNRKRG